MFGESFDSAGLLCTDIGMLILFMVTGSGRFISRGDYFMPLFGNSAMAALIIIYLTVTILKTEQWIYKY